MSKKIKTNIIGLRDSKGAAIAFAVIFLFVTLVVSFVVHQSQKNFLARAIDVSAQSIENTILKKSLDISNSINRMVERWKLTTGSEETFWRADAKKYIGDVNGIDTMMWVDNKGIIQWIVNNEANYTLQEGNVFTYDEKLMSRLQQSKIRKAPEFSDVSQMTEGNYALHVLFPIWKLEQFDGYIGVRIDIHELFTEMLNNSDISGFVLHAYADGVHVFKSVGDFDANGPKQSFRLKMDSDQDNWEITVYPTAEVLALFQSPLPIIILLSGSSIALLFFITLTSRIKAKKNSKLLANEIKHRRQIESKLDHMSQHDALTHLPNRKYLNVYLDNKVKESHMSQQKIAVLFLNIDDFKQINDTYTHQFADKLLKAIPNRINQVMKKNTMIAHMGGDEFVICIAENLIDQKLFIYAEDLLKNIRSPFTINNITIRLTASMGVSFYPEHGNKVNILITKAEQAMNQSKDLGKGIYTIYDETVKTTAVLKTAMIKSFNQALDDKEFEMYFQPRHDIKTGDMVSSEALLRWKTGGKVLSPDMFLEAAEDSGMIVNICNSAFDTAFAQYQKLFDGHPKIMLSINVSAKQLSHADFLNDLFAMLEHHQFPCNMLEVELTEQTLIENYESSLSTLNALNSAGVKIALDDFGTGYSSLSYLKNFPVDVLKIDKSFINDIHNDAGDLELTKAIIAMGKSLNMQVVAEGVENQKQLNILAIEGCHQAQGYLLSKPLQFDDFCELFEYEMHKYDVAFH